MRRLLGLMALCVAFAVLFAPGKSGALAAPDESATDDVFGAVLAPTLDHGDVTKKPHLSPPAIVSIGVVAVLALAPRPSPGWARVRALPLADAPAPTRLIEDRAPPRRIR